MNETREMTAGAPVDVRLPRMRLDTRRAVLRTAPLVEDNSVRSDGTTVVNLRTGHEFNERIGLALDVCNLFDSDDNDISYYYESQLPGEPAPVADIHFHPVEPRSWRLALHGHF